MGERKERIYSKTLEKTEKVAGGVIKKSGLDRGLAKIVVWAENNRMKTFAITCIFLMMMFGFTLVSVLQTQEADFDRVHMGSPTAETIGMFRSGIGAISEQLGEMWLMREVQRELEELLMKEKFTPQDSLRIMELYNHINRSVFGESERGGLGLMGGEWRELEELLMKEEFTPQDSVRIMELYNYINRR